MHFNGGTINWKPIDPNNNARTVLISITQSYSWTYPETNCAKDVPITTIGRSRQNANLTCVAGYSTDGGYSIKPINILTDCRTFSSSLGLMTSQRTVFRNLTADAHFSVSYTGIAWIDLNYPPITNLPWSLVTSIDLRRRPDGLINTPPVASVVSPQYAVVNQVTQIQIPVSDANRGDDVRCRWSIDTISVGRRKRSDDDELLCEGCTNTCQFNCPCCCPACARTACRGSICTSRSGCTATSTILKALDVTQLKVLAGSNEPMDECGGICYPASVPVNTTLSGSNCTISFKGTVTNTWYAVAIQVEDFINSTSQIPMSSIPVQFLIYVMSQQTCGLRPIIFPLQHCLNVEVGVRIDFNISAMTSCNPNVSDIDTITIASGIDGMNASNTTHSVTNASISYATFTWTPRVDQVGSQQLCVIAYSQEKLQSDQYCVIFNVTTSMTICGATSVLTTIPTNIASTSSSTISRNTTSTVSITVSTTVNDTVSETIRTTFIVTTTATIITTSRQTIPGGIQINELTIGIIVTVCASSVVLLFCCCCFCCCSWDSSEKHIRRSRQVEPVEDVHVEQSQQEATVISNQPPMIRRTHFMIALIGTQPLRLNYVPKSNPQSSKVTQAISGPNIAKAGNVIIISERK